MRLRAQRPSLVLCCRAERRNFEDSAGRRNFEDSAGRRNFEDSAGRRNFEDSAGRPAARAGGALRPSQPVAVAPPRETPPLAPPVVGNSRPPVVLAFDEDHLDAVLMQLDQEGDHGSNPIYCIYVANFSVM